MARLSLIQKISEGYRTIQEINTSSPSLKIVDEESTAKGVLFTILPSGTHVCVKLYATEIISDEDLFNSFSVKDKSKILLYTNQTVAEVKDNRQLKVISFIPNQCRLIAITPDQGTGKNIFTLSLSLDGKPCTRQLTIEEIISDRVLLNQLSRADLYEIAFIAGTEYMVDEMESMSKAKISADDQ